MSELEQPRPHIGDDVRYYRQVRRMSIADLAKAAGLSQRTVTEIENGERSPRLSTVNAICKALDISLEWMCSTKRPELPRVRFDCEEKWLE